MADDGMCAVCGQEAEAGLCERCVDPVQASPATVAEERGPEPAGVVCGEDRDRAAELRDRGAEDRDAAANDRDQAASDRDQVGANQDALASRRDQLSADEDQQAADADLAAGGSPSTHRRGVQARERSERDRVQSAEDRDGAAEDRQEAARERVEALHDRVEAGAAAKRALATLESMSDAFFTLDAAWQFTYLNPQTEPILERRREDLLGKNMWEEFPEAVGSGFDDAYRRALAEQVMVRFEQHYAPLGRTLEIRAYPVVGGLAVYFSDVTSERRRDAHHRQTQRLEALGQVTAGVSHDFNNLLTAIGGFASLGRARCAGDAKGSYYFDQIAEATQTASALTRQLLTFSREQILSPEPIDLNQVVDGLFSLLRQLLPTPIELRLALSPDPVVVFADRSQVEQVLINLVVNSRDAVDGAGVITLHTTTDNPEAIVHDIDTPCGWLQVADTGSGIPADVLPHIFDPYFSTKPADLGTGLGLATIYGTVSQSGGQIFVSSTIGRGTTMSVAIPAPV